MITALATIAAPVLAGALFSGVVISLIVLGEER